MSEIVYFLIISATAFCTTKRQKWFKHREELSYVHMYLRTCRLFRPICQSVNVVSSLLDFHFFFLDSILPPFKISHPWVEVKGKRTPSEGKIFSSTVRLRTCVQWQVNRLFKILKCEREIEFWKSVKTRTLSSVTNSAEILRAWSYRRHLSRHFETV
jgi:hypothetical protein